MRLGDSYMNAKGNAGVVRRVSFRQFDGGFKYRFGKNDVDCWRTADAPAKRPPLEAADGQPIEVGQTLYGESDGKAWTVDRIDHGKHHPVIAHSGSSKRGLKAGWLTHEPPDAVARARRDLLQLVDNLLASGGEYSGDARAEAEELLGRIGEAGRQ